jgi:branched-chain amino acid aminotransferase
MNYFNFNGKIYEENKPVIGVSNRGLRYGDGLFETLKYKNKELILANEHFARLWKGMQLLQFDIPKLFTPERIQQEVIELLKKNKQPSARIRLTIIRGDGGIQDAQNHKPNYIIQTWPLATDHSSMNENGLQLCIYTGAKKTIDLFSNIKHNNYLPYFMGALFAKEQHCNDAILLNNHERICDSTIANVFIIKNEMIFTPRLEEGCVAGIMRKYIIHNIAASGYSITETLITKEMLLEADEVFLSNSMYNIRWVAAIANKNYSNNITRQLFEYLHQTNAAVFC